MRSPRLVCVVGFEQIPSRADSAASVTLAYEASPVTIRKTVEKGSNCSRRNSSSRSWPDISLPSKW